MDNVGAPTPTAGLLKGFSSLSSQMLTESTQFYVDEGRPFSRVLAKGLPGS